MIKREKVLLFRMLIVASIIIAWEILGSSGIMDTRYTSKPSEIIIDLIEFIKSREFFKHAKITIYEAISGLLYGTIAGLFIGIILGQFKLLGNIFKPIIDALYSVPQLTLAPVYILWFGIGLKSKIFLASLLVFFQVFFATINAIREMNIGLVESAILLGASKSQITKDIVIPTCTPWILVGIRTGIGSSLVGAIIGEYMGASAGFGWMIAYATSYFKITRVMTCITILLTIGMLLNSLLNLVERKLLKWNPAYIRRDEK
ncbi:MAG: ABC transporter permease [Andreesenia angusta]|nr:ABC transporter permease [Andreesenia angusta]